MGMYKRGQGPATGTAVLLAIITALLVAFIILIPPAERAELLGDNETSISKETGYTVSEKNLLTVSPGRIDYLAQKEIEHPLPVVHIYTKTEAKVLAEKNIAYLKKSVFSEENSKFSFSIPDLENTKNVLLTFNVLEAEAEERLVITFNDEEIFNAEVVKGNIKPIKIPSNLLQQNNLMTFSASSPGLAFWATNEISLENIRIVADVTSLEAQSSKNIFLVSDTEKENLETVILKFQPECNMGEVGKLTVTINGLPVYSGMPDCELAMIPIEFSPAHLNLGENEIVFFTEKGMYLLSHVVIESNLEELIFPTYYFELSYEQYQEIADGKKSVELGIDFVDVVARKYGSLVFNGHVKYFDTKEISYAIDLSEDVVQGANAIQIKPKKTLDVRELKVDLVK